ncbi:MAG: hypothetical protein J7494_08680 [Sphingobium sp.]|nr:hypothetical protein [Sphingobium sp.]
MLHAGHEKVPVLIIDNYVADLDAIVGRARALAPYPQATGPYPGERRLITPDDSLLADYVGPMLDSLAPLISDAFDADILGATSASLSRVTTRPENLTRYQSLPHFDDTSGKMIAILHYLTPTLGTALYRHRATGLERITQDRLDYYLASIAHLGARDSYMCGSNDEYEMTASIAGHYGRIAVYPSNALHSGMIPPDHFTDLGCQERLTANIFIRLA